ncbi:hypothetical protein D3C80_1926360 [compost metagenome]
MTVAGLVAILLCFGALAHLGLDAAKPAVFSRVTDFHPLGMNITIGLQFMAKIQGHRMAECRRKRQHNQADF